MKFIRNKTINMHAVEAIETLILYIDKILINICEWIFIFLVRKAQVLWCVYLLILKVKKSYLLVYQHCLMINK